MNKKEKKPKKFNVNFSYLLIVLLGILLCIPLFTMSLGEYNEARIHIGRAIFTKEIMKDGIFPPFISYKNMLKFGYAINIFYGVFTTYIPIFISLFTGSSIMALKIFTVIVVIFSGITMYSLVKKITKNDKMALIASLVYMAAPYKICDIYARNAVGEYTAFVFIPMVFQGIYELFDGDKKGNILLVAGASLLILSHTITTIYTAIFALIFILYNFKKTKNSEFWKQILLDILLILLLTAFYTVPIIEHKIYGDYVIFSQEMMHSTGIDVYNNTNKIKDWFAPENKTDLNFSLGLTIIILTVATIFCYKKVDEKYKDLYTTFLALSAISLIMCTKVFPWVVMPSFLTVIQFAWRMNGFFIFFISLVCGINVYILANNLIKSPRVITSVLVAMIFALAVVDTINYNTLSTYKFEDEKRYEKVLVDSEEIGPYNINRDYLPVNAAKNIKYMQERENCTYVISGNAEIENEEKDKLTDKFDLNINSQQENTNEDNSYLQTEKIENNSNNEVTLELPYLYYHGYTTKVNGEKVRNYEDEKGFLTINANENGKVEVEYTGTAAEKFAFVISILTLATMILRKLTLTNNTQKYNKKILFYNWLKSLG